MFSSGADEKCSGGLRDEALHRDMPAYAPSSVGIVVIGRNEGERLRRCLESVIPTVARVIYVDSDSADRSVAMARSMGVEVVELDVSTPLCAARARNAGYQRLVEADPQLRFVQFIDGDCEIIGDWLLFAVDSLESRPDAAIVAGWLRERSPDQSIYNRLGNLEWNFAGIGEVDSVGGIFMIRREAFDNVGGFDPTVAAGEEPELCQRLIQEGWRLLRLDRDMALHDLAMMRFGQWWRRMVRSGYGSMDVAHRFGVAKFAQNNWRVQIWSAWLVLLVAGCAAVGTAPYSSIALLTVLLIFTVWPAQWLRIALRTWRKGQPLLTSVAYAFFIMIAFLPQIVGQITYFSDRLRNRSFRLVEYKSAAPSGSKSHR